MKFKSKKKAEQYAISSINGDDKVGYVIIPERNFFRTYYYVSFYFKTVIADYES